MYCPAARHAVGPLFRLDSNTTALLVARFEISLISILIWNFKSRLETRITFQSDSDSTLNIEIYLDFTPTRIWYRFSDFQSDFYDSRFRILNRSQLQWPCRFWQRVVQLISTIHLPRLHPPGHVELLCCFFKISKIESEMTNVQCVLHAAFGNCPESISRSLAMLRRTVVDDTVDQGSVC